MNKDVAPALYHYGACVHTDRGTKMVGKPFYEVQGGSEKTHPLKSQFKKNVECLFIING